MFIGRERELTALKEWYDKDGIGMMVIYGRRRIGKSTLITEFAKGKRTIFYTATKIGKNRNLELFSKQVVDLLMPGLLLICWRRNSMKKIIAIILSIFILLGICYPRRTAAGTAERICPSA